MNLILYFSLAFLTIYTEAVIRIPLKKYVSKKNAPPILSSSLLPGSLVINATLDKTSVPLSLDTTTDSIWVISQSCKSKFCKNKNSAIIPRNKSEPMYNIDHKVKGWKDNYTLQIDDSLALNVSILVAEYVWPQLGDSINFNAYGVIGLKNLTLLQELSKPNGIISITTSGKNAGFYVGIPANVAVQDINEKPLYINCLHKGQWIMRLDYISNQFGDWNTWCSHGCKAVIDSNFNGISGPTNAINSINAFLGADENGNIDCYKVEQLESLIIHIGGKQYYLDPKNYIRKGDDLFSQKCKTVFVAESTDSDDWRLGIPLFDQFLVVFDVTAGRLVLMKLRSY